MSFVFSKILWAVLTPLNLILILMVLGLGALKLKPKWGRGLLGLALALFIIGGALPVGHNALVYIETYHSVPESLPDNIDGIIILGGALDPYLTDAHDRLSLSDSSERIFEGAYLTQNYPDATLIYTGGEGALNPVGQPEAGLIKALVARYGLPVNKIVYEGKSRNTYENAVFSRNLVKPETDQSWVLVTSAYHMPRAYATFVSNGWSNVTPWPVDYRTDGQYNLFPKFNVLGNFSDLNIAWHEFLGISYYLLTYKISLHNRS